MTRAPHPDPARRSAGRAGSRARATMLVDQGMSSVSNILAVILVARAMSAPDFGRFAVAFAVLTVVLTLSRSYFGTRVSLAERAGDAPAMTAALAGSIVVLAPLVVLAVVGLSVLGTGTTSLGIVLVVALATPVVCLQDVVRFGASAADRPAAALASDTAWVLVMLVPFVLGLHPSAATALALWAGGAVLAAAIAFGLLGRRPDLAGGLRVLRTRHRVGESLTLGSVISTGAVLWVTVVASTVIGPVAAGSLRGAAAAMGPVNVLIAFTALGLTPALVRRARSADLRFCATTAAALAALAAAWGVLLLLLPDPVGRAFLGESWTGIRAILPWTTLEYVGLTVASAAVLGLKVRGGSRQLVTQRAAAGAVSVLGSVTVALFVGATWAVAAVLALAALVSVLVGWAQLARHAGSPAGSGPNPTTDPSTDPSSPRVVSAEGVGR